MWTTGPTHQPLGLKPRLLPSLKKACGSDANAPQIRVPLSQGEMRRKRLRAEGASERGLGEWGLVP